MSHNLYQSGANGDNRLLTSRLDSFCCLLKVDVDGVNDQLTVSRGCFGMHVSDPRPPQVGAIDWKQPGFLVEGAAGRGSFSVGHAKPLAERKAECVNEFSRFWFAEFDVLAPRAAWFSDEAWTASFDTGVEKAGDPSRFLYHRLTLGDINDRWVHAVVAQEGVAGVDSLLLVTPFVRPSICHTLLSRATQDGRNPGYMPTLTLKTSHGHDGHPDLTWTHFPGSAAGLPGAVSGFAMLCQGGFKNIALAQLPSWLAPAAAPGQAYQRFVRVLSNYGEFERNLEKVGRHVEEAAVVPPADNLPVEALYLTGLASRQPTLP